MFLREAYAIFKDKHPEYAISFSTFCKLRPENVYLLHETPIDQCKYMICENFSLKLKCLKITYDSETFWEKALCDKIILGTLTVGKVFVMIVLMEKR